MALFLGFPKVFAFIPHAVAYVHLQLECYIRNDNRASHTHQLHICASTCGEKWIYRLSNCENVVDQIGKKMINHDPIYHRCWPIGLLVALLAFCDGNPLTIVESPSQSDSNITVSSYGPDGVSNHQSLACLLNRLFGHRSKKTSNRVPTLSGKTGKWHFHGKWGKSQGICQAQRILENRNISGNSQRSLAMADLSAASEKCHIICHMFCPQFPNHLIWKHIFISSIQIN